MNRSMTAGCLAVAVMNFVFMVAELMAGRLAAPWVGVSSYTWVSLTVAALAGCAAGNALAAASEHHPLSVALETLRTLLAK